MMKKRPTNAEKIREAWCQSTKISWPPKVGEKVKMWWPAHRGKVALVVASEDVTKKGFAPVRAGSDKIRIQRGGLVALVSWFDVFPSEFSVKDIEKIEVL